MQKACAYDVRKAPVHDLLSIACEQMENARVRIFYANENDSDYRESLGNFRIRRKWKRFIRNVKFRNGSFIALVVIYIMSPFFFQRKLVGNSLDPLPRNVFEYLTNLEQL